MAEGGAELGGELGLEANLGGLGGLAFAKGCYVGQEPTSRTHFRGVVRKRVLPVRPASDEGTLAGCARGTPLLGPSGEPLGRLLGVCGDRGLALLRVREALGGEGRLRVEGGPEVRTERPRWWPGGWGCEEG